MMYFLGLALSTVVGCLSVRLISAKRLDPVLRWFLGTALGFGISGYVIFYTRLCLGWSQPWAAVATSALICLVLVYLNNLSFPRTRESKNGPPAKTFGGDNALLNFGLLAVIAFLLTCEAVYYPIGGWDAWSCWNLKAKFIYSGGEHWKSLFDPVLWRSNTQYPLLLPCINVWFWDWAGADYAWVPMINSVIFTVLCAAILLFGLRKLTGRQLAPLLLTAAVFLLPFNVTLSAGQYSDILLGLFLLCAFMSFLHKEFVLMGIFIGLLSFTKTEGTVAAVILAALALFQDRKSLPPFLTALVLAGLPTIIFTLFMAPHNEAFINGLLSALKPSTFDRLRVVLVYPVFELLSFKWNGLWIILLAGLALKWKTALGNKLWVFAAFFGLYAAVVLAYYQVNTFFEIGWWMQNTLNRILFALLPSLALWLGLAL